MELYPQPNIEPITDKMYQLVDDFTYVWNTNDIINKLTIPKGFRYDGATVPRIAWTISGIRPDGLHRAGSLVHDYIYHYEGKLPLNSMKWKFVGESDEAYKNVHGTWSRKDTDKISYKMWREYGQPRAYLLYYFSRIFGYFFWIEL